MRHVLTALILLAGLGAAQASQSQYNPAALGHDAASAQLARQYAGNNAIAAQARAVLAAGRIGYGRPQRQAR